ncbi:hypothetical protein C8T65DRAFT_609361 [Cerioporus squamosus]|nr:hypothetical protein C8T65DRAFT_609361 [Cerioporus squamosus]
MHTLPHDVLCTVISFSDREELFALMLASRDLQLECAKYIFHEAVKLNSDEGITSFISFMRRNQRRRWCFLRSLEFSDADIHPSVAGELGRVISRASRLEVLFFEHAENTLRAHPQLGLSLAAIPTVKHIELHFVAQHACRMLEAMSWPLESAILQESIHDPFWLEPDKGERMHPAALLKNARTTLQTIKYDMWSDYDFYLPDYPVYSALHTFRFDSAWLPPTTQWPLSYPNLKSLELWSIDGDGECPMDECTATRLTNMSEYGTSKPYGWPELEHFSGRVLDLYILGLPCRIHDVRIRASSDSVECLEAALSNARPSSITVDIWDDTLFQGRDPDLELPSHLRIPGMAEVKFMKLNIVATGPRRSVNFGAFLEETLDALSHLHVQELVLYVEYPDCRDRSRRMIAPDASDSEEEFRRAVRVRSPSPSPCPLQVWAETVDALAVARRAFSTVRSLKSFELIIHPPYTIRMRHPIGSIEREDRRTRVLRDEVTAPART